MIIVTAIVSPMALPRANKIPPVIPDIAAGRITLNNEHHLVAPIPYAASFNRLGTCSKESLYMAVIIGSIITTRINIAGASPGPTASVLNNGNHPK